MINMYNAYLKATFGFLSKIGVLVNKISVDGFSCSSNFWVFFWINMPIVDAFIPDILSE
jgi:hypothetical protein